MKVQTILAQAVLVSVLLLASVTPALAQNAEGSEFYYYYFDEQIPLTRDKDRIGVFEATTLTQTVGSLTTSLARHGITSESVVQSPVPNLSMCKADLPDTRAVRNTVAAVALEPAVEFATPVFSSNDSREVLISPHLHVAFNDDVAPAKAEAILAEMGVGRVEERDWAGMPGVYRIRSASRDGFKVLAMANRLAELPETKFAEPDMIMTARKNLIPDDPYFPSLWGLHNTGQSGGTVDMDMDGPEAWDINTGDPAIITVILDDGVQQDHPDINQIAGHDFTSAGTDGGPGNQCDNHGTTVAGCTSAIINNGLGVVGIAPDTKVASAKYSISNVPCDGSGYFYINWFVNALNWAQTIGARVTNCSSGFGPNSSITSKYQQLYDAGIVHFASSGNSGGSGIGYPASLSTVNAVGAINRYGNRAYFSTYGSGLAFVAPGQQIWTTDRTGSAGYYGGDYASVDGTSYSSPYAAGVAAMILTVDDTLTAAEVGQIMNDNCMDRGATGYDIYYGWGILNAHDAMQAAWTPGPTLLDGECWYDAEMVQSVLNLTVNVQNLTTSASWPAATTDNYYSLTLEPGTDIDAGHTLRYIATDDATAINVTDHVVTQDDINNENIHLDLILDEYYLNLSDFPMYDAEGPDVNKNAGPAVAQMTLNYIWWDSTVHPTPPLLFDSQQDLFDYGVIYNETPGLNVLDVMGMWHVVQDNRPLPYSQYGYNFTRPHNTDGAVLIKQIAQWISYPVGTYGGHEEGYPLHVPGIIPAFGDYSNWMVVRGIHTSENAYPLPPDLEVYGFWLNDPVPAGIGENSYKTVDEFLATYYLPLATGDSYDGEFVAICEPPDSVEETDVAFVTSPARFDESDRTLTWWARNSDDPSAALTAAANQCVTTAAVAGVTDELIPYDPQFAELFATTRAGEPLFVTNARGADYYSVPFFGKAATIVVLVDAEEGRFKEASWLDRAETYLPVSRDEALGLAYAFLEEQGYEPDVIKTVKIGLALRGLRPYYPEWRFATEDFTVYVSQSADVTIEGL